MKKIIALTLSTIMLLAIGCAEKHTPDMALESFFSAIKENNTTLAQESMTPEFYEDIKEDLTEYGKLVFNSNAEDEELVKLSELESYPKAIDNLKVLNSKLDYEILNTQNPDENTAVVELKLTYADTKDLFSETISGSFSKLFEKAFTGREINAEENSELLLSLFNENFESLEVETKAINVALTLTKIEGKWYLSSFSKDTLNALTFGMYNSFRKIFPEEVPSDEVLKLTIESPGEGAVLNIQTTQTTLEDALKEHFADLVEFENTPEGTIIKKIKNAEANETLKWSVYDSDTNKELSPYVNTIELKGGEAITLGLK